MRLLEFSTEQVKAMHKFLAGLGMSNFDKSELSEPEKSAVIDGFGVFVGEAEEIALDEHNALIEESNNVS